MSGFSLSRFGSRPTARRRSHKQAFRSLRQRNVVKQRRTRSRSAGVK